MSILIRGMEMPKKGEYKPLFIYDTGEVTMEIRGEEVQVATAIPVAPHGRLIESKAFLQVAHETDDFSLDEFAHLAVLVAATPTIIPAEEGE